MDPKKVGRSDRLAATLCCSGRALQVRALNDGCGWIWMAAWQMKNCWNLRFAPHWYWYDLMCIWLYMHDIYYWYYCLCWVHSSEPANKLCVLWTFFSSKKSVESHLFQFQRMEDGVFLIGVLPHVHMLFNPLPKYWACRERSPQKQEAGKECYNVYVLQGVVYMIIYVFYLSYVVNWLVNVFTWWDMGLAYQACIL